MGVFENDFSGSMNSLETDDRGRRAGTFGEGAADLEGYGADLEIA